MKIIQQIITSHVPAYEALDGTIFKSKEECEKCEGSAKCVLMTKYNKLVVKTCSEYDVFGCVGLEDEIVNIVKLNSTSDIDTILKLIALYNPSSAKNTEWMQKREDRLTDAYNSNSLVVISRGYENNGFYISFTFDEIIKNITKISNEVN